MMTAMAAISIPRYRGRHAIVGEHRALERFAPHLVVTERRNYQRGGDFCRVPLQLTIDTRYVRELRSGL
jgi:hypothetical protein